MVKIPQIRGMLLEEVILHLIVVSGYRAVTSEQNDPTLYTRKTDKALCVRGRGENHQIDAIADFFLSPPFSHKQRLLIEAKHHDEAVGLPTIRNTVGVLKDVSEFWTYSHLSINRYHYQCAIISASGFTEDAQKYAFVQDIYLVQVQKSRYFQKVLQSIGDVTHLVFGAEDKNANIKINLKELREAVKKRIVDPENGNISRIDLPREARDVINRVCRECRNIKIGLLAAINGNFPLFLIPNPSKLNEIANAATTNDLNTTEGISIRQDKGKGWVLVYRGEDYFSFDVPVDMFRLYRNQSQLQSRPSVEIQGLLVNLGERVNDELDNGFHEVSFSLSSKELNKLLRS
jgi:hypothetical protein